MRKKQNLRQLLSSFVISVFFVGVLLGNAYMDTSIGYPDALQPVGNALLLAGYLAAIPPGMVVVGLAELGIVPELRGRENFIRLNPVLWIFCVLFYAFVFYLSRRLWQYWREKRLKTRS